MSTPLKRRVTRVSQSTLDGCFGSDRGRRIVITLIPGTGATPDLIELRPHGTRRPERLATMDVYRYAIRCRVGREQLEKARAKKARMEAARQTRALERAVRREQGTA